MTSEEYQERLDAMEQRAVRMNAAIQMIARLVVVEELDSALSALQLLREANWQQRRSLIAAGAVDSIEDGRGSSSRAEDGEEPIDVDALDLAALRSEFSPE